MQQVCLAQCGCYWEFLRTLVLDPFIELETIIVSYFCFCVFYMSRSLVYLS